MQELVWLCLASNGENKINMEWRGLCFYILQRIWCFCELFVYETSQRLRKRLERLENKILEEFSI